MDDDVDIYGDLPNFDINECAKCKQQTNEFTQKYAKLEEEILSWKGKVEHLEQEKKIILTNTSSLLKTARAEIDRKDKTIQGLRRELEDVKFRRGVWSKSNTNYQRWNHESREKKPCVETMCYKNELPTENVATPSLNDKVVISHEDEQDPEQKWDPASHKSTLYGERLRQKLLREREAEKAKHAESKNSAPLPDQKDAKNDHKDIVTTQPQKEKECEAVASGGTRLPEVEKERRGATEGSIESERRKDELDENVSEEGELPESSDDKDKNGDRYWERDKLKNDRHDESVHRRRDNHHRDDSSNRNSHSNDDFRDYAAYKSRHRSRNDAGASGRSDREHRKFDTRQTHDLWSRLNYRSHDRPKRLWDRSDKYEKRREDGPTRENYESPDRGIKENREHRERFEGKYDDGFFCERRNDHDRNYDSDHKRLGKSRSPGRSPRSKSSGSRSSPSSRHRSERSKSRGRFTAESKSGTEKNRNDHKPKSRDRKTVNDDRADKDSQTIPPVSKSSNRHLVENAKKNIPEESTVTNYRDSGKKSTRASSRHGDGRPIEKFDEPLDTKLREVSKIAIDEKKRGSGDPEITTGERHTDPSIEPISKCPIKNCGSVENTKNGKIDHFDKSLEKTIDCVEREVTSSKRMENFVDPQDKFILMLENDSEIALNLIAKRETDPSGSRSCREEKIENIEKFILDYKDDAIHCSLLGNDLDYSQQKEEFANSTSSIVDTLSMDMDDLENELETKSEKKTLKTTVQLVSNPEKDENSTTVSKIEKNRTTEKPPSQFSLNNELKETAIDEESKKAIATEIRSEKKIEARVVVEKKIEELVKDKKKEMVKKCENSASIDKKSEKSTNNTQLAGSDGKLIDKKRENDEKSSKTVHKKVQKVDGDKELKVTESIESINENKENKEKFDDLGMSTKLETTQIIEKTEDPRVERKCEVSRVRESKNVNLAEMCDDKNDKKVENTADSGSNGRGQVEASDGSKNLSPPLPPSPDLALAPPLPPSPELVSLPPLPPSPPPEEKEFEISCVQKVCTFTAETNKLQGEKVVSKQPKNRPRIPCISIVSLYSRKRRGMILTDSTSSRTVVTSLKSTQVLEVANERSVNQKIRKIESEPVSVLAETKGTETTMKKIESEKSSTGSKVLEAKEKAAETQFPEPKQDNKIISKTKNCSLEYDKPEVKSSEPVAASDVEETRPENQSVGVSSLTEKNVVDDVMNDVDDKVKENQAEVGTTGNCEKIPANCTSSKSCERAKRTVLKTIASTTDSAVSTESATSRGKRPLSKEKENQSKPPKQAKIMIISRRRPVQLQDSSTVTTLVPSVHEDSSKNNKTQSAQKNITASGWKRRAAES